MILVYDSAPAIKENLGSIITAINNVPITSIESLVTELSKYSVGDEISVQTKTDEGFEETFVTLEENPDSNGKAWLGIGFQSQERTGLLGKIINQLASFKKGEVYYEPKFEGLSIFFYNMIWWVILISVSVAIMNMLPVGIFDGGRFFYLTVLGITKSEKIARRAFATSTYFFLFILFLLMFFWGVSFFR